MNRKRYAPDGSSSVDGFWNKAIDFARAVEKQEREAAVQEEKARLSVAHEKQRIAKEARERAVRERINQLEAERAAQADAEAAAAIESEALNRASRKFSDIKVRPVEPPPANAAEAPVANESLGRRFVRLVTGY